MSVRQQARIDQAAVDAFRKQWEAQWAARNARIDRYLSSDTDTIDNLVADFRAIKREGNT